MVQTWQPVLFSLQKTRTSLDNPGHACGKITFTSMKLLDIRQTICLKHPIGKHARDSHQTDHQKTLTILDLTRTCANWWWFCMSLGWLLGQRIRIWWPKHVQGCDLSPFGCCTSWYCIFWSTTTIQAEFNWVGLSSSRMTIKGTNRKQIAKWRSMNVFDLHS